MIYASEVTNVCLIIISPHIIRVQLIEKCFGQERLMEITPSLQNPSIIHASNIQPHTLIKINK